MEIYITNISNRLKALFYAYLNRLEEEKKRRVDTYNYRPPSYGRQQCLNFGDDYDFQGIIYFYEWSNVNNTPRTYYTLKAFENFLEKSGIYIQAYQRELIRNIHNPYIACRHDGKDIIIKCNYDSLKHALDNEDRPSNPFRSTGAPGFIPPTKKGSEDEEPYTLRISHAPTANPPKVINMGVYAPNLPTSMRKPPMYTEAEQVGDWFG